MRVFFLVLLFWIFGTAWGAPESTLAWKDNAHWLPSYCKDRAKGSYPRGSKWRRVFGKMHISMHHYCEGIYSEMKARSATNPKLRRHYSHVVVKQMSYVGNGCQVGCVLYPDLHKRWAWALAEQGEISGAVRHYRLSIRAKPDYSSAYAGLSDLYVDIAQLEEAILVLEKGLRAAPKSKMLKRRLEKLRGSQ